MSENINRTVPNHLTSPSKKVSVDHWVLSQGDKHFAGFHAVKSMRREHDPRRQKIDELTKVMHSSGTMEVHKNSRAQNQRKNKSVNEAENCSQKVVEGPCMVDLVVRMQMPTLSQKFKMVSLFEVAIFKPFHYKRQNEKTRSSLKRLSFLTNAFLMGNSKATTIFEYMLQKVIKRAGAMSVSKELITVYIGAFKCHGSHGNRMRRLSCKMFGLLKQQIKSSAVTQNISVTAGHVILNWQPETPLVWSIISKCNRLGRIDKNDDNCLFVTTNVLLLLFHSKKNASKMFASMQDLITSWNTRIDKKCLSDDGCRTSREVHLQHGMAGEPEQW